MNWKNTRKLRDLVKLCGGEIVGRKKMQKIVFIIQECVDPFEPSFEYRWNYYGVYSTDLSSELEIGQFFKILQETPVNEHGYQSYAITVIDEVEATPLMENEKLKSLAEFLNAQESRLLEVISSIIFFRKQGYSPEEEKAQLAALKGHLSDFFEEAYSVLEKIEHIAN